MATSTASRPKVTGWRGNSLPVAVVVLGLLLTGISGWKARGQARAQREERLDLVARESREAVQRQVNAYAEALFGLRNLFAVVPRLSRIDFRDTVSASGIFRRLPGARALTFIRAVPAAERGEYETLVRSDSTLSEPGYPEFVVHPETNARELFVVEYAEPVAAREAALGYDAGSDPIRRAAVEEARDSGDLAATAPIRLLAGGTGFWLCLAVYDTPALPVTPPARRRHFLGLVTAVFDVPKMFDEVVGRDVRQEIEIFDMGRTVDPPAGTLSASRLVFDADRRVDADDTRDAAFRRGALDLDIGSRRWRLVVFPRSGFGGSEQSFPWVLLAVGLLLTGLVSGLVFSFGRSRRLAIGLAGEMTASLRQRERELEETNERLARANDQLSDADRAKNSFLSTISHELQTPLTSIRGFSDLLTRDAHTGEPAREYASRIARNASALSKLINELLEFSRLERGQMFLSREPLSISELALQAVDQLGPVLDGYDVQLEVETDVVACADPDAVTRILTNLLANAVKFSSAGSVVRVAVTRNGNGAVLSVADEGPGVPDDERDQVFDRFFRGGRPEVAETSGTGIGLAVVKELAQRMGGSVSVENREPRGAIFTVTLPNC